MQIRHFFTTLFFVMALTLGVVACAPAASTTPDTPPAETGGMDDAEPSGDIGVDDSNGMPMNDLSGNWQASTINGTPVDANVIPSLSFGDNGEVAGNAGCNGYGGTYTVEEMTLSITGVVSTMMACEDQTLMTQETDFLSALQVVSSYTIEGDTLTLLDGDGNALVTLTRA